MSLSTDNPLVLALVFVLVIAVIVTGAVLFIIALLVFAMTHLAAFFVDTLFGTHFILYVRAWWPRLLGAFGVTAGC